MFLRINKASIVWMLLFLFGCINSPENTKEDKEMLMLDSIATLYHNGDFEKSIELGKRFTVEYPSNDKGFHLLSSSYLAKDKDSLAEIYADKSLVINPDNHIALTNKGILLDRNAKYDEAAIYYERSLRANILLAQTYSNYMLNRIRVADYVYAVDLGERALKYENNIWDKANLCYAYHKIGIIPKRDSLLKELKDLGFEKLESLEETILRDSE